MTRKWRPRAAWMAAPLVLVLAVAGTAGAAKLITGKQIKNRTVTGKDIKKKTLTASHFKAGTLLQGAKGDKGDPGTPGSPGATGERGPSNAWVDNVGSTTVDGTGGAVATVSLPAGNFVFSATADVTADLTCDIDHAGFTVGRTQVDVSGRASITTSGGRTLASPGEVSLVCDASGPSAGLANIRLTAIQVATLTD